MAALLLIYDEPPKIPKLLLSKTPKHSNPIPDQYFTLIIFCVCITTQQVAGDMLFQDHNFDMAQVIHYFKRKVRTCYF